MAEITLSDEDLSRKLQEYDARKKPQKPQIPDDEFLLSRLAEYDQAKATQGTIGADYSSPIQRFGSQARSDLSFLFGPTVDQQRTQLSPAPGLLPSMGKFASEAPEIVGEAIPTPTAQNLQDIFGERMDETPGFGAKVGAGVFKANAKALGYVATLGPVLGLVGKTSPLLGRVVEGAVGVDILAHTPDMKRNIEVAAEQGDVEGVARGITEMGLGLWFGTSSIKNAGRPGAASESPIINDLLTTKIRQDYTPEQLKSVYQRVNRGEATPAEVELVRFVNKNVEAPGQAIRQGVEITETAPLINSPRFNKFMGVDASGRRVSLRGMGRSEPKPERANEQVEEVRDGSEVEPVQGQRRQIKGPVEEVRNEIRQVEAAAPVSEPAGPIEVPSPPPAVMAIARRTGRALIPMSGPDSVHWFTFDGYQERGDGSYTPQLTPVGGPAPDNTNSLEKVLNKLRGYAPLQKLPTPMEWAERRMLPSPTNEAIPPTNQPVSPTEVQSAVPAETPTVAENATVPKLRSMENQGDLLSSQVEDLTLTGERGTDFDRIQKEKLAAETRAKEAAEIQAKQQLGFDNLNAPVEGANREQSGVQPVTGKVDTGLGSGVEPSVPTTKVKRPVAKFIEERPPDIIDAIQDIVLPSLSSVKGRTLRPAGVGIQTKKYAKDISEYNESYDILWKLHASNPGRKLFAIGPGGTSIDELRDMLRSQGAIPESATGADVFDMILDALDVRKNFQGQNQKYEKTLNQKEQFQNVAIENKRQKSGDRDRAVKIPASYLEKGDEFKLDGDLIKVGGIDSETGGRIITNGERFGQQTLNGNEVIYADYRTLKKADPAKQGQPIPAPSDNYEPIRPPAPPTDDNPFSIVEPEPEQSAQGIPAIRQMIEASSLPANTKRVFVDFLSQPVMQQPEFADLVLEMRQKLELGGATAAGIADFAKNAIELSMSDANATTLPHEVFHFLFEMLSPADKALVRKLRVEAIQARYGEDAPAGLVAGTMTSEQAVESGMPLQDYPLINDSEYLADIAGDEFSKESFASRNDPKTRSLIDKIKTWLRELLSSIKRMLGFAPSKEQLIRDILAGKRTTSPESGRAFDQQKQASFVKNRKEAKNAEELAVTRRQQEVEGTHMVGQAADITMAIEKHGGVTIGANSQALLDYEDFVGIQTTGERLLGTTGGNYRSLKLGLDVYEQRAVARLAATQMNRFENRMNETIKLRDKEIPKITGPAFINLAMREMQAKQKADMTELNSKLMNSVLDTAIKKAERVMRQEAKTDRAVDEIRGQIRELYEAKSSSVAMFQLLEDMVTVLASTPDGWKILTDPNFGTRTDIAKIYQDIKRSTGQPLHSPTLIRWATHLIQRNKRLWSNMVAAHLNQQSPIRQQMTTFEKDLTDRLKKNPAATIKTIRRQTDRMATDREKAEFVWKALNRKVVERLEEFNTLNDAAEVAEKIKADPDWQSLSSEVNQDAGWVGDQKPFEVFQDQTIVLPSGREVDVSSPYFVGSKTLFQTQRARIESAIGELKTFIANPANGSNKNIEVYRRQAETLENYYTGLGLLDPNDSVKVWKSTFGILQNSAQLVGGRVGVVMMKAIRKFEAMHGVSAEWMQKHSYALTASRAQAMLSHDMKWGSFGEISLPDANAVYYDQVANPLAWSHNRQEGGFKVGDTLPGGWKVTKEDMDHLRMQSEASAQAFKEVDKLVSPADRSYLVDTLGGYEFYRKALQTSMNMTPRTYFYKRLGIGEDIQKHQAEYNQAIRKGDQPAADAALSSIVDVLDANWKAIGPSLVNDRNPAFALATPYDGVGGALPVLGPDAYKFGNARDFFTEVANLTADPIEEVTKTLALEWARPIAKWFEMAKPESDIVPRAQEQTNAFTQSRNLEMAPYAFYENGFKTTASLSKFAAGMQSRAIDEMVGAFRFAVEDVQRQIREFDNKVDNLRTRGMPRPEMLTRTKMNMERANGKNFDNYNDLKKRLKEAENMLSTLVGREPVDNDIVAGRLIGLVTGSLIGTFTTLRNMTDGPRYVGQVANRLMASSITAYPAAFWYGIIRAQMPFLFSGAITVAKSPLMALQGTTVALHRLITGQTPSARHFAIDAMEPFLKELGNNLYDRIKVVNSMVKDGIMAPIPPAETELTARLLGSLLSGGQILDQDLTKFQKGALSFISLAELLFLNPSQKVNPKFGDAGLNASMYMLMNSSMGPLRTHETRWREIANLVRTGKRAWDPSNPDNPVNRLSHQEIFPRGIRVTSNEGDMMRLREVFLKAGLDYDAVAGRFINQILAGNTRAPAMTPEEKAALINTTINMSNRSTAANAPQFAKSRNWFAKFLSPFYSWGTRMLSNFLNLLSVSARAAKKVTSESELRWARVAQWGFLMSLVVLPMIAFGALYGTWSNEELRVAKELVYNQIVAYRQPWEREGGKSQAIGWAVEAANTVPILGGLMSSAINDMPVRASMDPNFVMIEKVKDATRYVGGVLQTGDIGYKLPEFAMGMVPDARVIMSRTPFYEGRQELNNAANVLRRYGPMDDMRPMGGRGSSVGVVATELTPFGDRMANAAIAGDMESFQRIYSEAVQTARDIGKPNPETAVREMFRSRNPYDRVFKSKLSEADRENLLKSASPDERKVVEEVERKFSAALASIGGAATFTSEQAQTRRSGATGGTASAAGFGAGTAMFGTARSPRRRTGTVRGIRRRGGRARLSGLGRTRRRTNRKLRSTIPKRRRATLRGLV